MRTPESELPGDILDVIDDASNTAAEGYIGIENTRGLIDDHLQRAERNHLEGNHSLAEGHERDANGLEEVYKYSKYALNAPHN